MSVFIPYHLTMAPVSSRRGLASAGGVGDVALQPVELGRREESARRDQHPVQLAHHRRLADPGKLPDEHQAGRAAPDGPVGGGEQGGDLALAPVQALRHQQPVRDVALAGGELAHGAAGLPVRQAAAEVARGARGGLVALFGVFASSFMTTAESWGGTSPARVSGGGGFRATWQCTHSRGSEAVKGRLPVSAWQSVTPSEYRSLRESTERFILPVCSGDM
jgi:hypothetical protein